MTGLPGFVFFLGGGGGGMNENGLVEGYRSVSRWNDAVKISPGYY